MKSGRLKASGVINALIRYLIYIDPIYEIIVITTYLFSKISAIPAMAYSAASNAWTKLPIKASPPL